MKKKILYLVIMLLCMLPAQAQKSGWGLGVEVPFSFSSGEDDSNYIDVTMALDYRKNLSFGFAIDTEVGLFYENNDKDNNRGEDIIGLLEGVYDRMNTWGLRGSFMVMKNISKLDIMTGPIVRYVVYQEKMSEKVDKTYHAGILWGFGLGATVWKLYVKAVYELHVTKQYGGWTRDALNFGVSYRF